MHFFSVLNVCRRSKSDLNLNDVLAIVSKFLLVILGVNNFGEIFSETEFWGNSAKILTDGFPLC